MAIRNKGWAYVSGSDAGDPGGSNTQVQYNDAGVLQGNANFTFDGTTVEITGNLATSINISASAFYGDGSNLTGITASAVNVADGPEQAIQFRVDTPVSGEISGSSALMFLTASNTLSGSNASFTTVSASNIVGNSPLLISASVTTISGNLLVCDGTASISNLSGCSPIQVLAPMQIQSGYSLSFNGSSDTFKITNNGTNLDINGANIILNATSVSASTGLSASAFYFGAGGRQQISDTGTDMSILAASTGMFISADGGNLTLQGQVAIDTAGVLSSSVNISASSVMTTGFMFAAGMCNFTTINTPTTIPANYNSLLYGPITIANGIDLRIMSGSAVKIRDISDA